VKAQKEKSSGDKDEKQSKADCNGIGNCFRNGLCTSCHLFGLEKQKYSDQQRHCYHLSKDFLDKWNQLSK
jgi:hypothetical protein